jgi:hypothetical protein
VFVLDGGICTKEGIHSYYETFGQDRLSYLFMWAATIETLGRRSCNLLFFSDKLRNHLLNITEFKDPKPSALNE